MQPEEQLPGSGSCSMQPAGAGRQGAPEEEPPESEETRRPGTVLLAELIGQLASVREPDQFAALLGEAVAAR